jgi:hypothetical protein
MQAFTLLLAAIIFAVATSLPREDCADAFAVKGILLELMNQQIELAEGCQKTHSSLLVDL